MDICDKENALFERWKAGLQGFVTDGVVDQEAYLSSSPKILFLLKEVNDPDGGGWCLREFVRDGGRPETWNNVTRWVHGIRSLPAQVPWSEIETITKEQRCRLLRTIAAVNLKKTPGGHTTDVGSFWRVVKRDAERLREQFLLYSADLVICCGSAVADAFDAYVKPGDVGPWSSTTRGVDYLEYSSQKFVVSYAHPEARVAGNLLYYGLVDAVREILPASAFGMPTAQNG